MTPDKIREVIEIYRIHFEELGVEKEDYPHEEIVFLPCDIFGHCYGMLDKMLVFLEEGKVEKAFRWLGFIQGCLWSTQTYTLENLMNHNRPS